MRLRTLLSFMVRTPLRLVYRIETLTREFNRAVFISAALSEGIYDVLAEGPRSCEDILKLLGSDGDSSGLKAWLDLGVSIGELKKDTSGYRIKGFLSRELTKRSNDAFRAYLQTRVEVFYRYVLMAPAFARESRRFELDESSGELFARSSKTVEPVIVDLVDRYIPSRGPCRLLEVGCGSGIYIARACERNPELNAIGLEVLQDVAELAKNNLQKLHLGDRVSIQVTDVRDYEAKGEFDIVTLHNLIYYFPENERRDLIRCLSGFLKPGGTLILTSLCQGPGHAVRLMNLWASMSQGCGPLPRADELRSQLKNEDFDQVTCEKPVPSFYYFEATRPGRTKTP